MNTVLTSSLNVNEEMGETSSPEAICSFAGAIERERNKTRIKLILISHQFEAIQQNRL
jgi:hypothetical protein